MNYSITEAFSDCSVLMNSDNRSASQRLQSFIESLDQSQIQENYLALARLFWKLPYSESVDLAHVVIERYLWNAERWSDIYLWSLSALRQVPIKDTVWITRNFLALSLQALGRTDRAQEILRENWMSLQLGSGDAHDWLLGGDLVELRASWLDYGIVSSAKAEVAKVFPSKDVSEDEKYLAFLAEVDSDQGLTSYLLDISAKQDFPAGVIDNALLAAIETTLSHMKLDQSDFLVTEAAKAELRGEDASVAIEYLSAAAVQMNEEAYVPLVKILKSTGLLEQAIGYANVAVWRNIPGSANQLISLLGLENVNLKTQDEEVDEATKVTMYRLASGKY
jgi:tetratricopeptide (TPR) repeat protein